MEDIVKYIEQKCSDGPSDLIRKATVQVDLSEDIDLWTYSGAMTLENQYLRELFLGLNCNDRFPSFPDLLSHARSEELEECLERFMFYRHLKSEGAKVGSSSLKERQVIQVHAGRIYRFDSLCSLNIRGEQMKRLCSNLGRSFSSCSEIKEYSRSIEFRAIVEEFVLCSKIIEIKSIRDLNDLGAWCKEHPSSRLGVQFNLGGFLRGDEHCWFEAFSLFPGRA